MANDVIERLRYYEHQYLGALDFEDEQGYHRDMRRRHNIGLHAWGIVVGLELEERDPTSAASTLSGITIPPDEAVPYQDLPSDDADPVPRWLVRLGSVNWDASPGARVFLQADPALLKEERQYVSLIGERALVPRQQLLI